MQSDMLGSRYYRGYGDVLDGRSTKPSFAAYGRGDMHGRGNYDETGMGIVNGEIGDSGDGAGSADGYGDEDGTSEEV